MVECEMTCHAQSFVNHQWAFAQAFSNCKKIKTRENIYYIESKKEKDWNNSKEQGRPFIRLANNILSYIFEAMPRLGWCCYH